MVSIVTSYHNDRQKFEHFWMPLMYKHHEIEFVFVDNESKEWPIKQICPELPNIKTFTISHTKNESTLQNFGVRQATREIVYLTSIDYIPTYQTMILLPQIKTQDNVILFSHIQSEGLPESNSFAVVKSKYLKSLSLKRYISVNNPNILRVGGVYDVNNT